jgi:hypothetical protein
MTKKVGANKPGPKKGHVPDFSGVPGELVAADAVPAGIHWGTKLRGSPYDPLLKELAEAGAGKMLKFGNARARTSIVLRARKLGLKVVCGEDGGALYVKFVGREGDDLANARREKIRQALKIVVGITLSKLLLHLRDKGDVTIDAPTLQLILSQMMRAGEIIHADGDQWRLNPMRKVAA